MNIQEMKKEYEKIYGNEGVSKNDIELIEKKLFTKLPLDFKKITEFYSGGYMGGISHFGISEYDDENIIKETIKARVYLNLPTNYLVLAEPPESLILMDTQEGSSVLWVDSNNIENISEKWNSYTEFFQYLLEEELSENK
ncbi:MULTISPECIES: SMI1/KNR4 family protein [unclassified Neisseria]|uniref:SMI1/KNR4 family protein n=1 Tax=unclassified Neisseria TaxID=2623750 RepID=UPI001ADD8A3D|nr:MULTISPECIES: SMI1/KNR4 family protein [unclassified Neisseria]